MEEKEIKTAVAKTCLNILADCPYCGFCKDYRHTLFQHLDYKQFYSEKCEAEIHCDYCGEMFIVNKIEFNTNKTNQP